MADNTPFAIKITGSGNFVNLRFVEVVMSCASSGGVLASGGDHVRLLATSFGLNDIQLVVSGGLFVSKAAYQESHDMCFMATYEEIYSGTTKVADAYLTIWDGGAAAGLPTSQSMLDNVKVLVFGNPATG
ncbi:MAG: hypothetical protein GY937_20180 [bacterium]|nr:hypothetical protein [bacterium]